MYLHKLLIPGGYLSLAQGPHLINIALLLVCLPSLALTLLPSFQTTVSIKRLQKFLISEELEPNNVEVLPESDSGEQS